MHMLYICRVMGGGDILLGALAAALIVIGGALYALFFALGRLYGSVAFKRLAWLAYAVLAGGALLLAHALNLEGGWLWIVAMMLAGYLLAPSAIWHLSVATHGDGDEPSAPRRRHREA